MEQKQPYIPLLFAADINVYSVARAFHERYGIVSHVYGKASGGPCVGSRIIKYNSNPQADKAETLTQLVNDFAKKHSDKKIIVIGCGDSYVRQISFCKQHFPENVVTPYSDHILLDKLIHKEHFYSLCERVGLDYPDTFIHKREMEAKFTLPFEGPFIIKPSNGIEYWEHPFTGQDKIFKATNLADLREVLKKVYDSGYNDSMVIQNFIPGDDTYMRVLTNYSDQSGKVKLSCLGHVLLEEHTPHGSGNHAVIITGSDKTLEGKFRELLEGLGYTGFSNFDIKYDRRDGKYKVFELNARQGRSNYYVTGAGANIASYLVDDLIYHKDMETISVEEPSLWMVVPKKVAFDYVGHDEYRDEMRRLIRANKYVNPLIYAADRGFKRGLRIQKNLFGHFYKFKKYYGKNHEV